MSRNRRFAKNTFFLYIRMFSILIVNLFVSRIVLDKLGVVDYGIYNVVYGFAMMFTFFQSSLSNATQRFLNVEYSKGNYQRANSIFCQSLSIYGILLILIFVFGETLGNWFILNKMVVPVERIKATLLVFQTSLFMVAFSLISTAYDAILIAREDMKIYSYVGVLEALLKFLIAIIISNVLFDRLVFWGGCLALISLCKLIIYILYCKKYQESKPYFLFDKSLFNQLLFFIGWNSYGSIVNVICGAGVNLMINTFFGPMINAARAVAAQLENGVVNFTISIYTASKPQIISYYAENDIDKFTKLLFVSTKVGFLLACFIVFPGVFYSDYFLSIWLKEVPLYASLFTIWTMLISLVVILEQPIITAFQATGEIKAYYSRVSTMILMSIPLIYVFFNNGADPLVSYIILFIFKIAGVIWAVYVMDKKVHLFFGKYIREVFSPLFLSSAIVFFVDYLFCRILSASLLGLIMFTIVSAIICVIVFISVCLNYKEREYVIALIHKRFK